MSKKIIKTIKAPSAIGPYSQAVQTGNMLFVSGQIPIDPSTGELITDNVEKAAERVLKNIEAILNEAGTNFDNVVKTTIFLKDIADFSVINDVYSKYFTQNQPARSCVQAKLPKDAILEIEVVAFVK